MSPAVCFRAQLMENGDSGLDLVHVLYLVEMEQKLEPELVMDHFTEEILVQLTKVFNSCFRNHKLGKKFWGLSLLSNVIAWPLDILMCQLVAA